MGLLPAGAINQREVTDFVNSLFTVDEDSLLEPALRGAVGIMLDQKNLKPPGLEYALTTANHSSLLAALAAGVRGRKAHHFRKEMQEWVIAGLAIARSHAASAARGTRSSGLSASPLISVDPHLPEHDFEQLSRFNRAARAHLAHLRTLMDQAWISADNLALHAFLEPERNRMALESTHSVDQLYSQAVAHTRSDWKSALQASTQRLQSERSAHEQFRRSLSRRILTPSGESFRPLPLQNQTIPVAPPQPTTALVSPRSVPPPLVTAPVETSVPTTTTANLPPKKPRKKCAHCLEPSSRCLCARQQINAEVGAPPKSIPDDPIARRTRGAKRALKQLEEEQEAVATAAAQTLGKPGKILQKRAEQLRESVEALRASLPPDRGDPVVPRQTSDTSSSSDSERKTSEKSTRSSSTSTTASHKSNDGDSLFSLAGRDAEKSAHEIDWADPKIYLAPKQWTHYVQKWGDQAISLLSHTWTEQYKEVPTSSAKTAALNRLKQYLVSITRGEARNHTEASLDLYTLESALCEVFLKKNYKASVLHTFLEALHDHRKPKNIRKAWSEARRVLKEAQKTQSGNRKPRRRQRANQPPPPARKAATKPPNKKSQDEEH